MRLAYWGSPPTPLLPKWHRDEFPNQPLPDSLRALNPSVRTVGDLDKFWSHTRTPVARPILQSLAKLVRTLPPSDYVVIPSGVDHVELRDYPLSERARNSLGRGGFFAGHDPVTVGMLMNARWFGPVSLIELMCVSELALAARRPAYEATGTSGLAGNINQTRESAWDTSIAALTPILAAARDFRGAQTLGDALRADLPKIAGIIGGVDSLESITLQSLVGREGIASSVVDRLEQLVAEMRPSWIVVLQHRVLGSERKTLEVVGEELEVTRERVRQIQVGITNALQKAVGSQTTTMANLLREHLPPVLPVDELSRSVVRTFSEGTGESLPTRLASHLLLEKLDYSCVDGRCFNQEALEVVTALRTAAEELADDVGLLEQKDLRSHLPTQDWNRFFGQLVAQANLHQVRGRIALRDSGKAHVKAAVLEIGRPATKEEIAERVGMTTGRVGAHLSVIPSVARADKDRWGLLDWIDDVYEGITAEIVQRINEDGGSTRLERLLEELPRLFGVSETSVRVYARTPYFTIHNGYVSVATEPTLSLRDLDDVVDGRTKKGVPYWTFGVESRYFDGYSIAPFPPELASELGCEPNGYISAEVEYPPGASAVSVSWPLASSTGASVGRVGDALQRLDVKAGDRVRLLIVGPRRVQLRPSPVHDSRTGRPADAADILERLKSRRQVF